MLYLQVLDFAKKLFVLFRVKGVKSLYCPKLPPTARGLGVGWSDRIAIYSKRLNTLPISFGGAKLIKSLLKPYKACGFQSDVEALSL